MKEALKDAGLARVPANDLISSPNYDALVHAYTNVLRIIESQRPSRQRDAAIAALESSLLHAILGDVGIDSPIRMR